MNRFAAAALAAALLSLPATAQDPAPGKPRAEDRAEPRPPAENEELLREKRAPGAGARPQVPQPPNADRKLVPPPVVVPAVEKLPVLPADSRVAPRGEGFVVLADGGRFVAYDRDGKAGTEILSAGKKVDRWWLSEDGKRLAYASGGVLYVAEPGGKSAVDLGPAPAGEPAFAADGARVAFARDGRVVVRRLDDGATREIPVADGLVLGDSVAFSADGRRIYALVGPNATEPDGVGAADLGADGAKIARVFQASSAVLRGLRSSPTGRWLAFVQSPRGSAGPASLRVLTPDGSDFRTLARAAAIEDVVWAPDGMAVYFSGKGANGQWQAWESGLEADAKTGEIPVRRLAEAEGAQLKGPVVGKDGATAWMVRMDAEGKNGQVGRVKVR
jgi:hypothetical protein